MDWRKDEFIKNIKNKLLMGMQLNATEIDSVISALIKSKGYTQEPYYEIVYHDEYDRKQKRIMQPKYTRVVKVAGNYIKQQNFEIQFNRVLSEEEIKEYEDIHDGM